MRIALDRAAARRVAESDSWASDHVLPGLSRLADHGFLWIVLAAALWASGNRQARRAAWRGLGSMAAGSTADGQPIWLSTDGEVATAETGFTHGKIPRGLVVYRRRASSHAGHADVSDDAVCVDDGHAAGAPTVHIPYSDR